MTPDQKTRLTDLVAAGSGIRAAARAIGVSEDAACGHIWRQANPNPPRRTSDRPYRALDRARLYTRSVYIMRVDDPMYAEIARLAKTNGASLAQMTRELIEWGLEAVADSRQ